MTSLGLSSMTLPNEQRGLWQLADPVLCCHSFVQLQGSK